LGKEHQEKSDFRRTLGKYICSVDEGYYKAMSERGEVRQKK